MANRILLPNGCFMSTPSVNPSNWKDGSTELLDQYWRIQYYFHDPSHPRKKKLVVVKGMNEFQTLTERRLVTKGIIEDEIYRNNCGYNPILKKFIEVESEQKGLHENLLFIDAFKMVVDKIHCSDKYRKQMKWAIARLDKSATKLKLKDITIGDLRRKQLREMLDYCDLPNSYYNKYLTYLSSLFREMLEYECCESNLARDIRKKKITNKRRETLSIEEHEIVMSYLKENHYSFYRYAMIFFYSASRSTELMRLKVCDVDINSQEFKVMVKKGQQYREEIKIILQDVMHIWSELISSAAPDDYLFSNNLEPGPVEINPNQITKRWYRLIKKSNDIKDYNGNVLKITADFYSLKHSFLDSVDEDVARRLAHHTTSKTTSIYRINQEKRDREALKKLNVKLKVV